MSTTTQQIAHPEVVSKELWLDLRKKHLEKEKELTKLHDRLTAERRRLPMVRLEKQYVLEGPDGLVPLKDLFEDRLQLIVYHFMFDPSWDEGCMGCTGFVDALGDLSMLNQRNTSFALISRAPYPKLAAYKAKRNWSRPWYSSFDSDFNYDFQATLDENLGRMEYNYRDRSSADGWQGESHGLSVFFRLGDDLFHTYSSYGRGVEHLTNSYALLDVTPYGRQEDWEDSPPGWPQRPTYG
jgi:predicted dithiol-disulfide oxidoreductase (DUF899 family)